MSGYVRESKECGNKTRWERPYGVMAKHSGSKSRMPSFKSWLHHLLFGTNTGKLNNCYVPKFPPMQIWIIQYLTPRLLL